MNHYISNYDEVKALTSSHPAIKQFVYCALLFQPANAIVDFGQSTWPAKYSKKECCPVIMLAQGWTDAKHGLIGGKVEKNETILEAVNREFQEESGSNADFTMEDYKFTSYCPRADGSIPQLTHIFVKTMIDRVKFNQILIDFHANHMRDAYLDEIFSIVGLPLFLEGPADVSSVKWDNNVWGLPRYLTSHGGGFLTPTLQSNYIVREHFIVILLCSKVVSCDLMRRVFSLSTAIDGSSSHPLPVYHEFVIMTPGLADLLSKQAI